MEHAIVIESIVFALLFISVVSGEKTERESEKAEQVLKEYYNKLRFMILKSVDGMLDLTQLIEKSKEGLPRLNKAFRTFAKLKGFDPAKLNNVTYKLKGSDDKLGKLSSSLELENGNLYGLGYLHTLLDTSDVNKFNALVLSGHIPLRFNNLSFVFEYKLPGTKLKGHLKGKLEKFAIHTKYVPTKEDPEYKYEGKNGQIGKMEIKFEGNEKMELFKLLSEDPKLEKFMRKKLFGDLKGIVANLLNELVKILDS